MPASLAVRIFRGIAVVFGVVTLTFLLLQLAPGDPVLRLLGATATPEQIEAQRHALGFDRPVLLQYVEWLGRALHGDLGTSIVLGRPALQVLGQAWPATALLVSLSILLSYPIGILIGVVQGTTRKPRLDTALSVLSVALNALPGYWLGLMLVIVCTYWLRMLPAFGAAGLDADFLSTWDALQDRLRHLILPLTTLTLIGAGGVARFMRGTIRDVSGAPFVVSARAKGLPPSRVIVYHLLRNGLGPVLTLLGLSLPALFSGAVFVEAIFAWPGVGQVLVQAVLARDFPVVMAATTVGAFLVVLGGMLADLGAWWADPRLRTRHAES